MHNFKSDFDRVSYVVDAIKQALTTQPDTMLIEIHGSVLLKMRDEGHNPESLTSETFESILFTMVVNGQIVRNLSGNAELPTYSLVKAPTNLETIGEILFQTDMSFETITFPEPEEIGVDQLARCYLKVNTDDLTNQCCLYFNADDKLIWMGGGVNET